MFGNIGIGELALIAVVAFLLFGPATCIAYARRAGRLVGKFQSMLSEGKAGLRVTAEDEE